MAQMAVDTRVRDQAEIKRSAVEAARSQADIAPYGEDVFTRYLHPPAHTCFPLEYAYHLLGDVRGKTVLDFGCGPGENTVMLARLGARVRALDISKELIDLAKRRLIVNGMSADVEFIEASAYDIPLPDESVDVVFGMAILHHLDLQLAAREVKRVLRKGGRAIFLEPVRNSAFIRFARNLIPYEAPDISPFERPLTDPELEAFAEGFSGFSSKAFALPHTDLVDLLPFTRRYSTSAFRLDRTLLSRFPSMRFYASRRVIQMVK